MLMISVDDDSIRGWFCIHYTFKHLKRSISDIHLVKVGVKDSGLPYWLARYHLTQGGASSACLFQIWSLFVTY